MRETDRIGVLYEDRNFLAVYKPAGVLTHAIKKSKIKNQKSKLDEQALTNWLIKNYSEVKNVGDDPEIRPGIVHRLDKDTSGVLLIARNQEYFEYLKKLFQTWQIKKTYLALVWGKIEPKTGVIEKPIRLKHGTVKRTVWRGKIEKEAMTEYYVQKYFQYPHLSALGPRRSMDFSLLKVTPKTGRTHQIRVHLASIGHPIVGDALYGRKENPFGLKRQFLHAESLEFSAGEGSLPAGRHRRIRIEAEVPDDLKKILKMLRRD